MLDFASYFNIQSKCFWNFRVSIFFFFYPVPGASTRLSKAYGFLKIIHLSKLLKHY